MGWLARCQPGPQMCAQACFALCPAVSVSGLRHPPMAVATPLVPSIALDLAVPLCPVCLGLVGQMLRR